MAVTLASRSTAGSFTYKVTPTGADAFVQCPSGFAARYLGGPSAPPSLAMRRGGALHSLLEAYTSEVIRHGVFPDFDLLLDRAWNRSAFYLPAEEALEAEARVWAAMALRGYRAFLEAERLQPVATEAFLATPPRPVVNTVGLFVRLSGRLDCVAQRPNGDLVVIDFKTGDALPTAHDLSARPSTGIYHLLAAHRFPNALRIEIGQLLPRTGAYVSVSLTPDEIERARIVVRRMVGAVAEEDFLMTPGQWCAFCPLQLSCPAHVGASTTGEHF